MVQRQNYTEIVVTVISVVSSVSSLYFLAKDQEGVAFTILGSAVLFLLIVFLYFARRHRIYSRFFRVQSDLSSLSNQLRLFHAAMSTKATNQEIKVASETILITTLEVASRVFSTMTGRLCVASIMMPNDEAEFATVRYSSNVDPDRQNSVSTPLKYDQGIVGKALSTNRVISWCLSTARQDFKETRMNVEEFYMSGMTCPVVVRGEAFAILNIDARHPSLFGSSERNIATIFSNLLAGAFELSEAEWENGYTHDAGEENEAQLS